MCSGPKGWRAVAANEQKRPRGSGGPEAMQKNSPCSMAPPLWSAHGSHKTAIEQSLESKRAFGALHASTKPSAASWWEDEKQDGGVDPFPASCVLTRPGALQGPEACLESALPHSRPHTPGSQEANAVELCAWNVPETQALKTCSSCKTFARIHSQQFSSSEVPSVPSLPNNLPSLGFWGSMASMKL